jgi:hypothetical protein
MYYTVLLLAKGKRKKLEMHRLCKERDERAKSFYKYVQSIHLTKFILGIPHGKLHKLYICALLGLIRCGKLGVERCIVCSICVSFVCSFSLNSFASDYIDSSNV